MNWRNRRVGVIGAGKSGRAAARLLARLGARVLLSDQKPVSPPADDAETPLPALIEVETGHSNRLLQSHLIIRSPGIPGTLPILRQARSRKIPVWSEIELGSRLIHPRDLVAVTGTNGKTTTATLIGEIYKAAGRPTQVAGNIGTPLCEIADRLPKNSSVVLEISSYQLENVDTFHPTISVILNITPDHLEHHGTLRAYAAAKARIFENQTRRDVCILNREDAACWRFAKKCPAQVLPFSARRTLAQGVYQNAEGEFVVRWKEVRAAWRPHLKIPGPHNIANALAAVAAAVAGGISPRVLRDPLDQFPGVEHRLEQVRTYHGVRYVNDSKSTNVDSTRVALQSFSEPLVLIMGGQGKGSPYRPLRSLIQKKVRRLLLIGEDAIRIECELGEATSCEQTGTLESALHRARAIARPGDVVLLSPACASFDQYTNYEERGRHFKDQVSSFR